MQKVIDIKNGITRMPAWRMSQPVDFELLKGENLAIVGPNGGGKSMFVDILIGRHPLLGDNPKYDFSPTDKELVSDNIKYIAFRDTYGGDNDKTYFLQQRWNQTEISEETTTAGEKLEEAYRLSGEDNEKKRLFRQRIYELFHLESILDKYVILLSSGELRKLMLASSIFASPKVLIIDNPFIGLDAETRDQLKELLRLMAQDGDLQIVLVLSKDDDIPDFISHVVEVKDMIVGNKTTLEQYRSSRQPIPPHILDADKAKAIIDLPYKQTEYHSEEVINMKDVSIRYGERTILKDLNWLVKNGERWALSGQNGAGKSTLLSLVCADNPQSYACDITLFGYQRGSGESIWDIKKHIGYVSPEMHRAYHRDIKAVKIVASGLSDSVGLYMSPDAEQLKRCLFWMDIFGIGDKSDCSFLQLSNGEQRLVLLARAFVKDPELLILDEPLHGLDDHNRRLVKDVINTFCERRNKTMVMVTHYKSEYPECINNSKFLIKNN